MIYVVLGMHKSGTTLVSQILHASGINMGDFDVSRDYDDGNHYEREATYRVNQSLLQGNMIPSLTGLVNRLTGRGRKALHKENLSYDSRAIIWRLPKEATPEQQSNIQEVIRCCNEAYSDWGFKDPRTCLTYPLWRRELPAHKVIVSFRSYHALIHRYRVYGWRQWKLFGLFLLLRSWTTYNHLIMRYVENAQTPTLVLSYDHLMSNDGVELQRLSKFVERPLVDLRDPGKYRNRSPVAPSMPALLRLMVPFLPANPDYLYQRLDAARL
jgi:hypothetical protein